MTRGTGPAYSQKSGRDGFTLIEIVLVVAIIAILVSLAIPSYQNFLIRAHRSDAIVKLLQVSTCQERHRALQGSYDKSQCLPDDNPHYAFAYSEDTTRYRYRVAAHPRGRQKRDTCGILLLDALGKRSVSNRTAEAGRCWMAR